MIKIESFLVHGLDVPFPSFPGQTNKRYFHIPPKNKDGSPGILELEGLDAVTLQRLRHHYDWRATDGRNHGKDRGELAPGERAEIGLLRIWMQDANGDWERLPVRGNEDDADEGGNLDAASVDAPKPSAAKAAPAPRQKPKAPNKPKPSAPKRSPSEVLSASEGNS